MDHELVLDTVAQITHDTYSLKVPRPAGYSFSLGQATDLAISEGQWRDQKRPITFASLPTDDHLEFIIKSYPEHQGVTEQIARLEPGDAITIGDAWGAIEDKGPGTFIAGGAGITPFVSILRARHHEGNQSQKSSLIFANKARRDIILKGELEAMQNLSVVHVLSDDEGEGFQKGFVTTSLIQSHMVDLGKPFYLCGPPVMQTAVRGLLIDMGVAESQIVREA